MDQKQKIALGLIGGLSAFGLGYMLTRLIKGQGGIFDNNPEIPGDGNGGVGSTPPGYIYDEGTKTFIKALPESEFKIVQLISGYPVMQVGVSVPASSQNNARVFQAQFALGHWHPEGWTPPQQIVMCGYNCPPAPGDGSCGCMGTGLDWFSRMGYPGHNDPCPICGGTGQVDITPPGPLDIAATIAAVWPELHLTSPGALAGGIDSSSVNYNYKIGNGVFVAEQCVQEILHSAWLFCGGITNQYINTSSRWYKNSLDPENIIRAADNPSGTVDRYTGLGGRTLPNPMPTNYSIIDTLATNIDCGAGYYYDGKKCVPGTHPTNPYKNQKYDVCVVLYEEVPLGSIWCYEPRDYMVAINAVTTGDAISEHDGSEIRPYVYNEGWQGSGYYMNIPGTSGAAVYVGTLEDYNNLV